MHLYLAYTDKIRGITTGQFKYIEHRYNNLVTKSLFNLVKDPYEIANLAYDEEHQDIVEQLQQLMAQNKDASNELNHKFGSYWAM